MSTSTISGAGITARLPRGWEGRIHHLAPVPPLRPRTAVPSGPLVHHEVTEPFLHLANFPLSGKQGTFGGGAVERMGPAHAFVALIEYAPSCLGTALFGSHGLPRRLRPAMFNPHGLQRTIPGQAGFQAFFTDSHRPFCLYVVLGSYRHARALVPEVNVVLHGITISGV